MMLQQMSASESRRENDTNTLRLENLAMPTFSGRVGEDLYRFIDQISHFLGIMCGPRNGWHG